MKNSHSAAAGFFAVCLLAAIVNATPTLTTLATFNGSNGARPVGTLAKDATGNLYGVTSIGGASNVGTVFMVPAGGGSVITLATFNGSNGASPQAGLIMDTAGNLYGTTSSGGASNHGTVFMVPAGGGAVTTLATFDGTNGAAPQAGLVMDSSGNLYGTTTSGGPFASGIVFKVPAGGGSVVTLAGLNIGNVGFMYSHGGLLLDGAGNLYGTASSDNSFGRIFKVPSAGGPLTTLATFDGSGPRGPNSTLISDAQGNLYGTSNLSNGGSGAVFVLLTGTGTLNTLFSFSGAGTGQPWGGLFMDAAGDLLGTTTTGTIFILPSGSPLTTLITFNGSNGADPFAGLVADPAGNLYGSTELGGSANDGTIYKLSGVPLPEPASTLVALPAATLLFRRRRRNIPTRHDSGQQVPYFLNSHKRP